MIETKKRILFHEIGQSINEVSIFHLLFADDAIFMRKWTFDIFQIRCMNVIF